MKITSHCTITFVILVLKSIKTDAACNWNIGAVGTECLLQCINENTTAVNTFIENKYNEAGVNRYNEAGVYPQDFFYIFRITMNL